MSTLKVNKVQHLNSTGDGLVVDNKGTVGIATNDLELNTTLVGAASSLVGLYIGDGSLLFSNNLSRSGGYYITTGVNALNAGPVSLNTVMTLDGTWVIVQYRRIMTVTFFADGRILHNGVEVASEKMVDMWQVTDAIDSSNSDSYLPSSRFTRND